MPKLNHLKFFDDLVTKSRAWVLVKGAYEVLAIDIDRFI